MNYRRIYAMSNEITITIKSEKMKTENGNEFTAYKYNNQGTAVDIKFRKESADLKNIRAGISKIVVTDLIEDKRSFYPRYWATYIKNA